MVGHDVWLQAIYLALRRGHAVFQMDITTAFLQTDKADGEKLLKQPWEHARSRGYAPLADSGDVREGKLP